MSRLRRSVQPLISRGHPPTDEDLLTGDRVADTEYWSVPELAKHLMTELADECGLLFSALVYRYRPDHPWIMDIHVRGVPASELEDPHTVDQLATRVRRYVDRYNYHHHDGVRRFVGPNVVVLREFEPGALAPGRVSVRRYHWRHPIRRRLARMAAFLAGHSGWWAW
ncbi:hypothetical protein JOD54_001955 [Actinokineospora baliensis]|uniref:hypothetical protein n=1 Tax=Actinokineospora baliensis TaxID=547056 RepID=UPI00195D0FA1|nr:hypothetical protein [Actinokineospora baliensis]MBM7771751.1 hypothetical protein [Actinokineospora baliensis]